MNHLTFKELEQTVTYYLQYLVPAYLIKFKKPKS